MRKLPNWIKAYCEYTKHLEAPDAFHLWTAIGTIAGALRGKVWIDMGYFKWKPNFFIVFVAPPGIVSKSTTLGVGMEFLRGIKGVTFGPDSTTWQALTQSFLQATEEVPGIGHISCLTVAASELGTFLDPRNREMMDVLTDLWDGRNVPWQRATKGEGITEIKNPWLNFLGCTTPGWLQDNFPVVAIKTGFTSRTVFVYGDSKRKLVAYPKLEMAPASEEFAKLKFALKHDLTIISTYRGEYHLTEDAIAFGRVWYEKHWNNRDNKLDMETFAGYIARKQTHIHKVAMVLAAACREEMTITQTDLRLAETLVTALEAEMEEVFQGISESPEGRHTALILRYLTYGRGEYLLQELWKKVMFRMSKETFDETLRGIVGSGGAKIIGDGTTAKLVLDKDVLHRYKSLKVIEGGLTAVKGDANA